MLKIQTKWPMCRCSNCTANFLQQIHDMYWRLPAPCQLPEAIEDPYTDGHSRLCKCFTCQVEVINDLLAIYRMGTVPLEPHPRLLELCPSVCGEEENREMRNPRFTSTRPPTCNCRALYTKKRSAKTELEFEWLESLRRTPSEDGGLPDTSPGNQDVYPTTIEKNRQAESTSLTPPSVSAPFGVEESTSVMDWVKESATALLALSKAPPQSPVLAPTSTTMEKSVTRVLAPGTNSRPRKHRPLYKRKVHPITVYVSVVEGRANHKGSRRISLPVE